jgi:hypothetical protein
MTKEQKIRFHLETLLCEALPPGRSVTAEEIRAMADNATEVQKAAAYQRALTRTPILLEDER